MSRSLTFRVSAALKNIIGRDLITDDNSAVFELVKNSYDAHATEVEIAFHDLTTEQARIVISDNGKGMDYDDLKNKWLFVAFSAKTFGTEDEKGDYRNSIVPYREYAGAKGIGRFSCDRLGSTLHLETVKKGDPATTHVIDTEWGEFEKKLTDEFINVPVSYQAKKRRHEVLKHGTILEITGLRSNWTRPKLIKLKDSLAKLINPVESKGAAPFRITLVVPEEISADEEESEERKTVNGEVKNFIFEALDLKTTKIVGRVSKDGKLATTELTDGNTLIYTITEPNHHPLLKQVDVTIYYLNQSAKLTFAKRMGLASRLYGHIFLYKNGIRIYPFGEPGEDPLNIEERKSRKRYSRLGTSEVMGRIEIYGPNPELKETSSRGDGLIQTETYEELKQYFMQVLERLEKYVVDVQEWGMSIEEDLEDYDDQKLKTRVGDLVRQLTDSEDIVDFKYGKNFISILRDAQAESASAVIANLNRIAGQSGNEELIRDARSAERKLNKLREAKDAAEKYADSARQSLVERESENLFLKAIKSQDLTDVLNLMHHIGISASTVQNYIKGIVHRLKDGGNMRPSDFKEVLGKINLEVSKVNSIARFATKTNFKVTARPAKIDLAGFIREYLTNVVRPFLPAGLKLKVLVDANIEEFNMEVRPLELTILVDNMVSNARKMKVKNIEVQLHRQNRNTLIMRFRDDGPGIPAKDAERIFDYGYTTTSGSGMGLTHIREVVQAMGGSVELNKQNKRGAEFVVTFNRF